VFDFLSSGSQPPVDDPYGTNNATKLRKMADALRARGQVTPQGQMVSGRFVAPSLLEQLVPLINTLGGVYKDQQATAAEAESGKAIRAARDTWSSSLPQAVAARNVATPDDSEDMPITHEPAKPVTTGAILKHTLAGLNIPGNEKAASIYNAGALADLTREDNQAEKRDAAKSAAAAAREKMLAEMASKAELARQRSEDTRLSIEQRREAARQHTEMVGMIAKGNQELRRLQIETTAATAKENREAKAATAPGKLSAKEQSDLDAWVACGGRTERHPRRTSCGRQAARSGYERSHPATDLLDRRHSPRTVWLCSDGHGKGQRNAILAWRVRRQGRADPQSGRSSEDHRGQQPPSEH